jgi:hypothetical protein
MSAVPETSPDSETNSVTLEALLERLLQPRSNAFNCQIDGVIYEIQIKKESDGLRLYLRADLGFMPYTAESALKRHLLKIVMVGVEGLREARIKQDEQGKIVLSAVIPLFEDASPEKNFARLILLVHKMKPFINLIGSRL